jgi:Ubiquitin-protein ligase
LIEIIGIVVIKSGFYDKGKFKFEINIPQGYPSQRFSIYFTTKVYHPLVNNETGELDITLLPVSDTPLADGLMFIRNIFVDTTYLNVPDSFNSTAYKK